MDRITRVITPSARATPAVCARDEVPAALLAAHPVATAVLRLMRASVPAVDRLAAEIERDPLLARRLREAARLLGGRARPPATLVEALVALGSATACQLTLAFALLEQTGATGESDFDPKALSAQAFACGAAMQRLALRLRLAAPGEAFCVGLLCQAAELALASLDSAHLAALVPDEPADPARRRAVTATCLRAWGLPDPYIEAARSHEAPERLSAPPDSRLYQLVWMLALARLYADLLCADDNTRRLLMPRLFLYGSRLTLEGDDLIALGDEIVTTWRAWASLAALDVPSVPPFDEFLRLPVAPAMMQSGLPDGTATIPLRVLLVEDDPALRGELSAWLAGAGYQVYEASDGQLGFMMALEVHPHILITDWQMPQMNGLGLAKALRQTRFGRSLYVLILTELDSEEMIVEAFAAGVDDYLVKPLRPRVLGARLRAAQRVVLLQQEVARDRDELRRFASELAATNRRLQEAALTDVLTGLPNRRYAIEFFEREWRAASRSQRPLACMLIDVDHFKAINDGHGHDAGDRVLKAVAGTIKQSLRAQDVVCRTGGDEFTVICPDTDLAAALICAERVRRSVAALKLSEPVDQLSCTLSIGVAARDATTPDVEALLKRADEGVYRAKQLGRNHVATVQALP